MSERNALQGLGFSCFQHPTSALLSIVILIRQCWFSPEVVTKGKDKETDLEEVSMMFTGTLSA
jgi:hypothetical protein